MRNNFNEKEIINNSKLQWRMLLGTMFCYLFFYTGRHNFGWAAKQLAVELNISYEKIGWISFSMLMGYAIGQLINGNLADKIDPKKMVFFGGVLSVFVNVLISFSSSYWVILVLWSFNGFFQSMAWAPGSKIITNWWPANKRGLAFGFYTMAAASSSIITYLFSIILIGENWRLLFRIPVSFLLVAVIIFYLVVKTKPEVNGQYSKEADESDAIKPDWKVGYKVALGNPKFLIACLSIGFQSMARYGLIFWIPLYFLGDNHSANKQGIWVSILLPAGMAIGAFSFGFISDRFFRGQRYLSISIGMFICSLISLSIFLLPIGLNIYIGVLIFFAGFFVYGPQANFWPLSPELLGTKYVGTGVGLLNMSAYIFAAIGEPLMGWIIDFTNDKSIIFLVVSVIALISSLIILAANISSTSNFWNRFKKQISINN